VLLRLRRQDVGFNQGVAGGVVLATDNRGGVGRWAHNDDGRLIVIVRPAANTTAIVRGKNNTTGNALVEAYILPP